MTAWGFYLAFFAAGFACGWAAATAWWRLDEFAAAMIRRDFPGDWR